MSQEIIESSDIETRLVTFNLGEEIYGVDITVIQEIIRMQDITGVPKTANYVEGVINLRGKIIPVIDLRKKFGLSDRIETKDTRIIVVEVFEKVIAMIVDSVSRVIQLPNKNIEPPSPIIANINANYMKGIGKLGTELIVLLNLGYVLGVDVHELDSELVALTGA